MYRVEYYNDGNINFQYDLVDKLAIIHCEVKSWKPSTLRKGYVEFAKFLDEMKAIGVTRIVTYTRQPRLVKVFGGVKMGDIEMDGLDYEVYECQF
jgi:hypothetical protein